MGDSGGFQKLPPGWDCRYDQATGNCYYINYFTKAMQLEDPRMRYKQLQNERCSTESIPMQPLHGSPYHVYPSNNPPAVRAFQTGPGTNSSLLNMSSSPLLSSRGHLEMSPVPFAKSSVLQTPRHMANMSRRSTIQETSFTNPIDTDAVVAKIQNMFPTCDENHIRLLLKKYYNREAVVISALQVEKHPVTMPGPFVTPPAQRQLYHSNSVFYMTPPARRLDIGATGRGGLGFYGGCAGRTASPVPGGRFGSVISMQSGHAGGAGDQAPLPVFYGSGSPRFGEQWRSSPKPHSSPKMKLRYMKNIFPKADELLLLDILAGADNNVQTASEKLISMGYVKRDFVAPKVSNRLDPNAPKKPSDEKIIPLRPKEYTVEEKEALQLRFKEKYPEIAERIIVMALESVNYAEYADKILKVVREEDETLARKHSELQTTAELDEVDVSAACSGTGGDGGDNIITVVLEATTSQANTNKISDAKAIRSSSSRTFANANKRAMLPSINVTTPTTTTTQIILSNSPIYIENESQPTADADDSQTLTQTETTKTQNQTQDTKHQQVTTPSPTSAATKDIANSSFVSSNSSIPQPPSSSMSFQTITTKSILARANSNAIGISGYVAYSTSTSSSASILEKLKLSRTIIPRDKSDSLKNSQRESIEEDVGHMPQQNFKSIFGHIATIGHNSELTKGADENLLLADYVTWNGANPDISIGHHKQLAVGPDPTILGERSYSAVGRNSELCKGPKLGLAKGSIYSSSIAQRKSSNIKCN